MGQPAEGQVSRRRPPILVLALAIGIAWAYWPTLRDVAGRWSSDPRYSHGYLVPLFALWLLWARRKAILEAAGRPNWGGVFLIAAGAAMKLAGAYVYFDWLSQVALLPCLAGLCVLWGGWPPLRRAWPAIGFLLFMFPLPYQLEIALGWPLQRVATIASTYALQTLGMPAVGEGNVVSMSRAKIGVIEACNGLSMMVLFFALSTGVAIVTRRPWIDRILIVASALPIAMIANVSRITVTGVLHETVGTKIANIVFHDLAGWLMMPLALALLGLELYLLSKLLVEVDPAPGPRPTMAGAASVMWQPGIGVPGGAEASRRPRRR